MRIWFLSVVFLTAPGCVTVGRVAPEPAPVVEPTVEPTPGPAPELSPEPPPAVPSPEPVEQPAIPVEQSAPEPPAVAVEEGVASYYARRFEGRRTANGERYRRKLSTCAHRKHPFGTILLVTAVETGKQATCRVNDRGPFKKSRVLDVSGAVAQELGMLGPGVITVRMTVEPATSASTSTELAPPAL